MCPDVCVCCDLMEQLATKRQRTTETNENQNEKEKADKRFLFLDSSFSVKPKRQSAVKETAGSFPNCPISAFSTTPPNGRQIEKQQQPTWPLIATRQITHELVWWSMSTSPMSRSTPIGWHAVRTPIGRYNVTITRTVSFKKRKNLNRRKGNPSLSLSL